ncbi:MAG: NOL1/NOP2/sun family putative RNA methylase [Candidatus Methanomethyliaceae archaeon]|nr:NOL1/NOP2/sun family putative RNA methylase [Candidatus Methanomethyliaceae archaeon]MDW7970264.1 NOL1/NOP2/sun family putative RNA methylase [Nitrososphaerota archaeon]
MSARRLLAEINNELYERLRKIDDTDEFFEFLVKPLKNTIRINTLKVRLEYAIERLRNYIIGRVPWCKEGFYFSISEFGGLPEYKLGIIFSQEAASMIPPLIMELQPGMTVLDIAAAPGAKTTQIAQYMENNGCIIANDINPIRANILISNIQRCGVIIAAVTVKDGRFFRKLRNKFDSVLVDAQCSNIGMIRKSYKHAKLWRLKSVYSLSKLQKDLLASGIYAAKPGGVIVYSTCTVDPIENEEVVDYALSNFEVKIEKVEGLPIKTSGAILEFEGKKYSEEVRKCLRIHPQNNDTEAFFIAKLRKLESY